MYSVRGDLDVQCARLNVKWSSTAFSIILYLPVWYCRKCVVDRGNGSEADDDNLDADIAMLEKKERSVERV